MGRKSEPLYRDPKTGIYYARFNDDGKRTLFSLDTTDKGEAMQRYPIVARLRTNWRDYIKTLPKVSPGPGTLRLEGIEKSALNPPLKMSFNQETANILLEEAIKRGVASYNKEARTWSYPIRLPKGDEQAALRDVFGAGSNKSDQINAIKEFYFSIVPSLFVDKKTALRYAKIWIAFLEERKIRYWSDLTDILVQDFRLWRQSTPIPTDAHPNRKTNPPCANVVIRHLKYIRKSFLLAIEKGYLKVNPLSMLIKLKENDSPAQDSLTLAELKSLLKHPAWKQNYLTKGDSKFPLPYTFFDIMLLIALTCRRRKEIVFLKIEDVAFGHDFVRYVEWKNVWRTGTAVKAFWLTPELKKFLKKLIGDRKEGYLFPSPWDDMEPINPDLISNTFDAVVKEIFPGRDVTLKNIRQSISAICEENDRLSLQEINYFLGHYSIKKVLKHYLDKGIVAQGKRLSLFSKKGIELMCEVLKEFF